MLQSTDFQWVGNGSGQGVALGGADNVQDYHRQCREENAALFWIAPLGVWIGYLAIGPLTPVFVGCRI